MPRFLLTLLLILWVGTGCVSRPPVAEEPDTPFVFEVEPPPVFRAEGVRLAALNAEFMFDGYGDEGQASFPHKGDPEKARVHRDKIGRILRMLNADVIMLAEVENKDVLDLLIRESLDGMDYQAYFVQGNDTFTGQDMGLLSRLPVEEVGRTDARVPVGTTSEEYGVSKNLWARITIGRQPTTLVGLHFLAQPGNTERKPRREAQAEVIRRFVAQEQAQGRAIVVLGDFNDYDNATPDLAGSVPITNVLQTIKAAGPAAEDDLRNVLAEVPRRQRFTALWDKNDNEVVEEGELTAIDHLLLSPLLYRRLREVRYVHAHNPVTDTDHFPIVVVLAR